MSLLRDRILSVSRPLEHIPVPEWESSVFIRPLSLSERLELRRLADDDAEITIQTVIRGVVDDAGNPVFTADDRDWLLNSQGNGKIIEDLAKAVFGASKKAPEALEKN